MEEAAKYLLSEQLKEEITEDATLAVQGSDSEPLEAALEEVNWDEIADHYLEKIDAALSPFGPVIFRYTRAQAIDDGVLIDVSATAREAGIRLHTCVTAAVWQEYVRVPEGVTGQDERGRLWDIVWMLRCAIVRERHEATNQINYQLLVRNDNRQADLVTLKAHLRSR